VLHYPELAAGAKPPPCAVEEDGGGSGGTCIVRFHAGRPYEDVAFRIVNREWERSRKGGFNRSSAPSTGASCVSASTSSVSSTGDDFFLRVFYRR
jgi:hypothetical protein